MAKAPPLLEIQLLGVPQLALNGKTVEGIRRKNRALVFFLSARAQLTTRDQLLAFFWPDYERAKAQAILRTMIHDLRGQLRESLQVDDQNVILAAGAVVDVHVLSAAVDSSILDAPHLAKALALYKGDFLEGFSAADSPQFDDWVAAERERYRVVATRGYSRLASLHEGSRDYPAALECVRKALSFSPYQEDLHRAAMRLLYLSGDRTGMIRQYETLRKLLDQELGILPMPETRTLYDALIADAYAGPVVESSVPVLPVHSAAKETLLPFVGRDGELRSLASQLDSGKLIVVEGEAGIGKTRLVSELISQQTQSNPSDLVLKGIAHELEQGLPYQPVLDAIRPLLARPDWPALFAQLQLAPAWSTELVRLLPELATQLPNAPTPDQTANEGRLWEALHQFFQALSRSHRVWFILDDLHWADATTVAWLGYLLRHISSPQFVVLATTRPAETQRELSKLLQALERSGQVIRIQLPALSEVAIQEMSFSLARKQDSRVWHWMVDNAEGNPFFLTELMRYGRSIGLLGTDGAWNEEQFGSALAIPATIHNLVESRLLRLSENARRILHIAAVIGSEFELDLVRQASSLAEPDVLDAAEELQSAHLIRPLHDDAFAFDHSLTMQVALQDMSESRQRALHRDVGDALESLYREKLDAMSGLIARHLLEARLPLRAAPYAFRAGQSASNLAAWVEAIAFFEQALAPETDDRKRTRILIAMGAAHFHKGDLALSSKDYQAAVELAGRSQEWQLLEEAHLGLNLSFMPQARFAEAIQVAQQLRESGPAELAACAEFIWGTSLNVQSAHPAEAEQHIREAERLLREQPSYAGKISTVQIKYTLAAVYGQQGRSHDAIEMYREVLDMLARGEGALDTLRHLMLYNNLGYHLHLVGDPEAADFVQRGIDLAREKGSLSHLPYLYSTSGEISMAHGDLDTAERFFREGLALAEAVPLPERIAGMTANLGLVARQRGDIERAREQLQAALHLVESLGNHHLEARIRIWLSPLLSAEEGRACLKAARSIAEEDGLQGLLEAIGALEQDLSRA